MPRRNWELESTEWIKMRQVGDDWEMTFEGKRSQLFTKAKYGTTERAMRECEREMLNRNRRLSRLRIAYHKQVEEDARKRNQGK
jgi:hypothetical protein